jgi:hypothetical protein
MTNHLNLVKECAFFVSNFSIKAQLELANKLVRLFTIQMKTYFRIWGDKNFK